MTNIIEAQDILKAIGVPLGRWQVEAETRFLDEPVNNLAFEDYLHQERVIAAKDERDSRKGIVQKIEAGTTLLAIAAGLIAGLNDQDIITGISFLYLGTKAHSWILYARNYNKPKPNADFLG